MKLQRWKQKLLSFAGKEVLIKAVANSIPVYPMTCFLFPKKTCKELDRLISDFWWGQNEKDGRRIHWKRWDWLSLSKSDGGMGFRSFQAFNKALLAKTAWRLLQNPEDLWCRILKGIYFPKEDFMKAKVGHKASWGWYSILEGRELLKKGLIWRIGNGSNVRVWEDKWIPGLRSGKLDVEHLSEGDKRLIVAELISDGRWDLKPIAGRIGKEEEALIRRIFIPRNQIDDEMIWQFTKDGKYNVKSGYYVAKGEEEKRMQRDPSSSNQVSRQMWKSIWSLCVAPRVKQFLWRVVNRAVAIREVLYKRKCAKDPLCPVCRTEVETMEHMLLLCPWANHCWFGGSLSLLISKDQLVNINKWLEYMLMGNRHIDEAGKALVAATCWGIWKGRCDWVFNSSQVSAERVVETVAAAIDEFWRARSIEENSIKRRNGREVVRAVRWKPPEEGEIKINVDGAFSRKYNSAGVGAICRNKDGKFRGGICKKVEAGSVFMVEGLVVREALLMRNTFAEEKVWIETDCEGLFNCIISDSVAGCEWQSMPVVFEILKLKDSVPGVSFSLVARQGNKAADYLAVRGSKGLGPYGWLNVASTPLTKILRADLESCGMDGTKGKDVGHVKVGIG